MLGFAFAYHTSFISHILCISEQTQLSSCCPNCATIQHGYRKPSGGKSRRNGSHTIESTSLVAVRCFYLCQTVISIEKLKIYTIDGSKYCAKNECNMMIIRPRRDKHPSSGANSPSDVAVLVNINA
jgi:hypothetical protein